MNYFEEVKEIIDKLDMAEVEKLKAIIRASNRVFILGVGGSAANASHAVNDFRKVLGIETYAPTDNVSELSARTNDNGWETVFEDWLKVSNLEARDTVLIFSVGGGSATTSKNLVRAIDYAKSVDATILGIVGRDGGYTKENAHVCVLIPTVNEKHITPHAESFQAIIWHYLVSD